MEIALFFPGYFTNRSLSTESEFIHEASKLSRYGTCVACLIKTAHIFFVERRELMLKSFRE